MTVPLSDDSTLEDAEFERELSKMVAESLESRRGAVPRVDTMAIPMGLLKAGPAQPQPQEAGVQFQVLMKKGAKPLTKAVVVPAEAK